MGICGPPPKTRKKIIYRKPDGKTLDATRRKKLVNMLKSEKKKKKKKQLLRGHSTLQTNKRPSTSMIMDMKSNIIVPPLNISSTAAPSISNSNNYSAISSNISRQQQPVQSEWTELMQQDAAKFKEQNMYLRKLKKYKQKEFANALKDQITLKRKKKPVIEGPRAYRKRIEEEKRRAYKAEKEAEKHAKRQYNEFKRVQDENLRIRRERIAKREAEDKAIEAKMLNDAKEGYRKQHEAIRLKMRERKNFMAEAMRESHGFKASLAAAQKKREAHEEELRQRHNAIVSRAFRTGKNHRKMEGDRIRAVQDRLYNLGKTWMSETKEYIGGINDASISEKDVKAYEAVLKAQEDAENMMKRKKKEAIMEQRKYLQMQIKQKEDVKRKKKKEEQEFARKCKEGKYLNDQIVILQQRRKNQKREKYTKELKEQLLNNELYKQENNFEKQDRPMTKIEKQMNSKLLKTLSKSKRNVLKHHHNSQPLLSIRSYNNNKSASNSNRKRNNKIISDSVIPPWQTDHKPTGELELHEYRKNLINPQEHVLNGTYELPMPDLKTGHWDKYDNKYLSQQQQQQRPGTTASLSMRSQFNYPSSRYSYTNDAYQQLRSSFHPRKKSNWFDD